jgi:hypothetical protein
MKPSILLLLPFFLSQHNLVSASWFSSDSPTYTSWDTTQLKSWLVEHNLYSPSLNNADQSTLLALVEANWNSASSWTHEQLNKAQKSFQGVQSNAFDKWDESKLRNWLLEQGVVAPKGPKEQLVLMAKSRYNAYTAAASSLSAQASDAASTAFYGSSQYQASKSISSVAAMATSQVAKSLDDSKDYIYSTWSDSDLKDYLVKKGVIKSDSQKKRDELLGLMKTSYASVANPVWEAWSDSYMRQWLLDQNLISPTTPPTTRADLSAYMRNYYYDVNDYVWSSWSDSDLKKWLVDNGYVKSDAQLKRDKMIKLVSDTYTSATSTIVNSYSDSQLRAWAIEHGYLRSDAQIKRDELVALVSSKYAEVKAKGSKYADAAATSAKKKASQASDAAGSAYDDAANYANQKYDEAASYGNEKYDEAASYGNEKYEQGAAKLEQLFRDAKSATKAGYLTWPDARLRAYLRQNGLSEDMLPTERPGLIQETRIRWVQTTSLAEQIYSKIADMVGGGVEAAEDKLAAVWDLLTGKAGETYEQGKKTAEHGYEQGKKSAEHTYEQGKKAAGEKIKTAGSKVEGEL